MTHRTPKAKAAITGASVKNPGRHAGRNEPHVAPIGDPSAHLKDAAKTAWLSFTAELPWLVESDRALLEVAAEMRAKLRGGSGVGVNVLQTYSAILSKLAATPVDRSRVTAAPANERDATDEFFPD